MGYAAAALILLTALVPLGGELWAGGGGSAPQRYALGEDPALIWMHLVTNLLIGLAYVAISGTLIHLTRKTGRKIPFLWAFVAFGVFIISYGATHFVAALTLWEPAYWMAGGVLWVTALASVGTAVAIPSVVPKVVDLVDSAQASEERRRRLLESEERFRNLLGNLQVGVLLMDSRGEILLANGRAMALIGLTGDELVGKAHLDTDWDVVYEDGSPFPVEEFPVARAISEGRAVRQVVMGLRAPGRDERVWLLVDAEPEFADDGGVEQVVCTLSDVSERRRAEERLSNLARYDRFTGLVNRDLFADRLDRALARSARTGNPVALMFVDLDRFKDVNDTLGHDAGDELLKEVGRRLLGRVRESDTVARLGGDEFAIILEDLIDERDADVVASDLLDSLAEPVLLDGHEIPVTASIGTAAYPSSRGDELLKNADTTMYRAKERGRNASVSYTQEMGLRAAERLDVRSRLRRALEDGEFLLHYQPQVDLVTGRIVGAEALLRWRHPYRGILPPGEFVPVLEETGLIVPVGEWVLETACRQVGLWRASGLPVPRVAVNLSARQLLQDDLVGSVERIVGETGMDPRGLEIEITESTFLEDLPASRRAFERLKGAVEGMRISVDDFGTGYSSLTYLKSLPVDTLKIGPPFVSGVPDDPEDVAIATSMIGLTHSLRLDAIAEGVETGEQLAFAREQRCAMAQGYYFSRPLPADAFAGLLASGRPLLSPLDAAERTGS
ncbi:MAG: EAL domain-containing protein [Actinomycetota bacterium]|nr:EAL domain-containing protein [Actinomycetota bacterium]